MTLRFSAMLLFCFFASNVYALPNDSPLDWKRSAASSLFSTPTSTPPSSIIRHVVLLPQATTPPTHLPSVATLTTSSRESIETKSTTTKTTTTSNTTHSSNHLNHSTHAASHALSPPPHTPSRTSPLHETTLPGPPRPNHPPIHFNRHTNIAAIFFEVLGGLAGLIAALALARCLYIYFRTPGNRRPPTPEVAEVERAMALLRTPFRAIPDRPPPPPYQPAPDYEQAVRDSPSGDTMRDDRRSIHSLERTQSHT